MQGGLIGACILGYDQGTKRRGDTAPLSPETPDKRRSVILGPRLRSQRAQTPAFDRVCHVGQDLPAACAFSPASFLEHDSNAVGSGMRNASAGASSRDRNWADVCRTSSNAHLSSAARCAFIGDEHHWCCLERRHRSPFPPLHFQRRRHGPAVRHALWPISPPDQHPSHALGVFRGISVQVDSELSSPGTALARLLPLVEHQHQCQPCRQTVEQESSTDRAARAAQRAPSAIQAHSFAHVEIERRQIDGGQR